MFRRAIITKFGISTCKVSFSGTDVIKVKLHEFKKLVLMGLRKGTLRSDTLVQVNGVQAPVK